jgi:hypothetical protein
MSQLTLVFSRPPRNLSRHLKLSRVPCKMLPVVSVETWRTRRLNTRLERLERNRPIAFELVEKWVEELCERMDREQTG